MSAAAPSRRERLRAQTSDEAKQLALRQIAAGGTEGLSLNAIAKDMGMSGPALYRYFASREELVTQLIDDGYRDLADAMARAAARAGDDRAAQFRAIAAALRAWALVQPHRYLLLFGTPSRTSTAPEQTVASAHRAMVPILEALADLAPAGERTAQPLERQLEAWTQQRAGPAVPGPVALAAVRTWSRLHGVLSLEIQGYFADMGFDAALLYDSEVEALLLPAS